MGCQYFPGKTSGTITFHDCADDSKTRLSGPPTRMVEKLMVVAYNSPNAGKLFRYSQQKMLYLIRNENIDKSKLNLYGLHLNKQGSTALAKNIINHINCLKYL